MQMMRSKLDTLTAEELIGREVSLVGHPGTVGHLTSVGIFAVGRIYEFQWFDESSGGMCAAHLDGFQLELVDDGDG